MCRFESHKKLVMPEDDKIAEHKRLELIDSIITGKVSDPITIAVSIGLSVGSSLLQRALSGGGNGKQQVGLMKGTIQLQNSQQGIFIPEIYGAGPEVTLESGSATEWQSRIGVTVAAGGRIYKTSGTDQVWNAEGASGTDLSGSATSIGAEDAFMQFVVDDSPSTFSASAVGFNTDTTPASGEGVGGSPALEFGVQIGVNVTGEDASHAPILARVFHAVIQGVHGPSLGTWYPGDVWRIEKRNGAYRLFLNSGEVAKFTPPTPSETLYLTFAGWRTGYGLTSSSVKIGDIGDPPSAGSGGCKVPAMIVWGRKPEKHSYITNQPTQGGKGHSSQTVENFFYTIDLRANFARGSGGLQLIREYGNTDILIHDDPNLNAPSGLYNADDGTVGVYDPLLPPDPSVADNFALLKYSGELDPDPGDPTGGGGTGVAQQGASGIAVYPGNTLQSVDATEEAAVDAQNGVGSTTAHRGMAGIVHSALNLQRWQNIPPNITAVWQHKTLKTLGDIYEYLVQRIVDQDNSPLLTSDDYDFSGINSIVCRGMLIDGGRYAPAAIIDNSDVQDCYNYFTTEGDGKMLAYVNGTEPSITIPIEDFGWLDGAAETNDIFGRLTTSKLDETKFPRQVDLKSVNPGSDWESDSQSAMRRVTLGNAKNAIQVSLTLNPDEARQGASRNMYRQYVGEPLKFQLSWKYLHLYPGYKITTIDTDAGITYVMRLLSVTGGIGVRDCEAILLETSSFDQSNIGAESPIYNPALPLPSASILAAMDMPAFRPGEESQFGMYFAITPRNTDTQSWHGASLFIKRNGTFLKIADFTAPAIMGRIVSVTGTLEADPNTTDNTSVITVDLYGSKAILESVTEADMIAGVNTSAFGDMIGGFATADRVAGWPNRWELSVLRTGQHNTADKTTDDLTGRNFALFNVAVQFVQLDISTDLDAALHMKAVSKGASLSDTAELSVICTGQSVRMPAPTNFVGFFDDGAGDLLTEWVGKIPTNISESYELHFLESDLTTVLGQPKIVDPVKNRHLQEYVVWDIASFHEASGVPGFSTLTLLPDGGVDILGALSSSVQSSTSAEVVGGFLIEFQIPVSAYLPSQRMSLFPEDSYGYNPDNTFSWGTGGSYPSYTARPEHDFSDSPGPIINISAGDRLGIYIRPDGIVEYHINYMPNAKPVFISSKSVQTTKKYFAYVQGERSEKVSWLRQGPEFKYSAAQQRLDNGLTAPTLPGTIYARVRQLSPFEYGVASPWTYGTFVR